MTIKEIKTCRELIETKIGDWVSIPVHSEERRVGSIVNADDSSDEKYRAVAFREEVEKIRVIGYWIDDRINPHISSISYITYITYSKNQKIDAPPHNKVCGLNGARFLDARSVPHTKVCGFQTLRHDKEFANQDVKLLEAEAK